MPLFDVVLQFTSPCLKQSLCIPKEFTVLHIEQTTDVDLTLRLHIETTNDGVVSDETMMRYGIRNPAITRASTELMRWIASLRLCLLKYSFYLSRPQGIENAETSVGLKLASAETSLNLPIGQLKLATANAETSINSSNELSKLDPSPSTIRVGYDVTPQTSTRIYGDSEGSSSELHSGSRKRRRLLYMGSDDLRSL